MYSLSLLYIVSTHQNYHQMLQTGRKIDEHRNIRYSKVPPISLKEILEKYINATILYNLLHEKCILQKLTKQYHITIV